MKIVVAHMVIVMAVSVFNRRSILSSRMSLC